MVTFGPYLHRRRQRYASLPRRRRPATADPPFERCRSCPSSSRAVASRVDASRTSIPCGPGAGGLAAPVRSTTSGWPSRSAGGDHARQPGRRSRRLRPDRPSGRGSETPALAERRELPPVPRLSLRMRAMTQSTEPLPRLRQGTLSQGPHACPRTSGRHRQAPTRLPARIGPPASLLETVSDAIADCGPVFGRCFPREHPRRPSLEFRGPDCANGRRVVHSRRIEAGQ